MDRLHVVIALAALCAAGCKDTESRDAPASGRVNAVKGKKPRAVDPASFCDARPNKPFAFPTLDGEAPAAKSGWRWVNVWATWCKPCVEELPMLRSWASELSVELVLVSVDETRDAIAAFEKKHGAVGATARLEDPEAASEWLVSLGLDEGAPLPIHVLVAPDGAVRCARAGAVSERDYEKIAALIKSP